MFFSGKLADGDLVFVVAKINQLTKPPDAGKIELLIPAGPPFREIGDFVGSFISWVVFVFLMIGILWFIPFTRFIPNFIFSFFKNLFRKSSGK